MPLSPFNITPQKPSETSRPLPWKLAAPSFVRPAGIAENCAFLADHVDEVGLCLFETEACLAYDGRDLPLALTELDLSYHVHLPLDLPWENAPHAWAAIKTLVEATAYLAPTAYVLHPDPAAPPQTVAERFAGFGIAPGKVLLENTEDCDLVDIWPQLVEAGLSACLDMGHVLAYSQRALLDLPGLWGRTAMLHTYAPHPAQPSRHAGLPLLDLEGRQLLQDVLGQLGRLEHKVTVMLEVFDEPGFMASLNFFGAMAATWNETT